MRNSTPDLLSCGRFRKAFSKRPIGRKLIVAAASRLVSLCVLLCHPTAQLAQRLTELDISLLQGTGCSQ